MKAVRIHRKGRPGVLCYEDVPWPDVPPGHVLVRVEAAGINYADVVRRSGDGYPVPTPLPYVLGSEFAGTVEELGNGVTGPAVGAPVFGLVDPAVSGCYAQYVAVPAVLAHPLPAGLDPADSTALLVQGLTALLALRDGLRLAAGESVLVLAAAGGVGSVAVQLARTLHAGVVVGAVGSPEKRRFVHDLGADAAVDYTRPDWVEQAVAVSGGRGFDCALVSGDRQVVSMTLSAMAPFGRVQLLGAPATDALVIDFLHELRNGRLASNETVGYFSLSHYLSAGPTEQIGAGLDILLSQVRSGALAPSVRHRFPLVRAAEAHERIEQRATTGKVVLLPWAS